MKAQYGIDAPNVVLYFVVAGAGCLAVSFVPGVPPPIPTLFPWVSASWLLTALILILASTVFKLRLRDRILDSLHLKGDERVLDMGCGRGLMLIGLAKRLPNGEAVGVDLWRKSDQSGNSSEATLRNAKAEGVESRVSLETADIRHLPFDHQLFDVVISSWAIHNIRDLEGREVAILEALRVLKPGGRLILVDIWTIDEYAKLLQGIRMEDVKVSRPSFIFLVPTKIVEAIKPIRPFVDKNLTLSS